MYASTLLLLLSLRCLTFHTPSSQHPRAPCTTASAEYGRLTIIPLSYFLTAPRIFFKPQKLFPSLLLLLLCGDISLNPGPVTASHFNLCTLNIRSLLNEKHYTALHDLISSSNHRPDAIALTETWITSSATNSQLCSCRPDGYSLISSPRQPKKSSKSSTSNLGGGIAFLIREPATVLASPTYMYKTFESSSVTIKLPTSKLTIYNIYRPPTSSAYSAKPSAFLEEFNSFLSIAVTTPHEFVLTGDFNIHVDNPADPFASQFLSSLSTFNLTQHVSFPTHKYGHTLDLVITSVSSGLSPILISELNSPSDHYPIFTQLNIEPSPRPPPKLCSFRRIGSIDLDAFKLDLQSSSLLLNPPTDHNDLLSAYNSTLSELLNKHAPIITKPETHAKNPWFNSFLQALKSSRRRLERAYRHSGDLSILNKLKTLTNRYHSQLLSAKKRYLSSLVHSNSSNPRNLWKTVNSLLHRDSSHPLPNSIPHASIADSFASFFTDKVSSLRLSLQTLLSKSTSMQSDSSLLIDHNDTTLLPTASFNLFEPATEAEITTLIQASQNKQCDLDPIPTSLLKDCVTLLVPTVTKIINLSLSTGTFPSLFKDSVVKPLLKKPCLDKELLSNYRPISNLSFLSKLSERVVLSRLNGYLTSNNLLNPNQSAYTKHHSTETVLASLYNKLVMAIGRQQVSCLCLLDISAAFDTIDHSILIKRLSSVFGISGTALLWIKSYLSSRSFTVSAAGHSSNPHTLTCGVPQGSVLGPLLFILYTSPLSKLISSSSTDHHLYADDTQLFISFSPHSLPDALNHLRSTITQISAWMTANLLCLNPSKTEFLIIGLREQLNKLAYPPDLCPTDLASPAPYSSPVRNLGIIIDKNLTFSDHISQLSRTCYMHIRDLRRLRPILDYKTACTIATSIVHSKLDYCNSIFYNIDSSQIKRLQTVQNALARAVTKTPKHHHITPVLKSLHWLKVPQRIHYKIVSLTYNALQTSKPSYIRQLFTIQPPGSTRSSSYLSLSRPPVSSSLKFCNRSLVYAAPTLWNGLPKDLRQFAHPPISPLNSTSPPLALSSSAFHSRLKTELFKISYPDSTPAPPHDHLHHRLPP